ncbi:MAG TPA: tripartite tricarboxylate transporter TctB family protein [Solirubrobacterales bacterium]|nr:tripartite tricarboxylate transporter TctB family protein [Solirubrobacterales bacterium]
MSDRLTGLVLLLLAVAYGVTAGGYEAMIGDPLGPAVFPIVLAIPLGLFALYLIVRPDREPAWPRGPALGKQVLALVAFVAYAYLLEPLGFVVSTFLAVVVLGWLLGARLPEAGAAGVGIAVVLFVLFDTLLGLPLPAGVLGFLG